MSKRPNILFLMSDQHRYDFMGHAGHIVKTPFLDELASSGSVFKNAYCASPICSPGRQCMMAGQYPGNCNVEKYSDDLSPGYNTFSKMFSRYAYTTAVAGKLHHCGEDQMQGWTHRFGWWDMNVYNRYIKDKNEEEFSKITTDEGFWSVKKEITMSGAGKSTYDSHDFYTVWGARQFIREYFCDGIYDKNTPDKPLFLKVSLQQPHYPYIGEKEKYEYYLNRIRMLPDKKIVNHPVLKNDWSYLKREKQVSNREIVRALAAYCAMIETCDNYFKSIVEEIEYTGQNIEDWIIIYTSDHGDMMGEYDLWWKLKFYEGSVKVPLIIKCPSLIKGHREIRENVNHVDIFPTLCDMAQIPVPEKIDGKSFFGLMKGDKSNWKNETYSQMFLGDISKNALMIKKNNLKYLFFGNEHSDILFDLEADPDETINQSAKVKYSDEMKYFRKRITELETEIKYNQNPKLLVDNE